MNLKIGERKIQKTNYSFLVPLPTMWVKNANLGQSSSVNIELLEDNSLKISTVPQARQDSEGTGSVTPRQLRRGARNGK
ncbi:hypothetical protein [Methanosarcina sp. Kolksee]|uniref:hypothetical protein n=1 Tax=Methanosarcina sp. Kolksee TaxID=1434099 RepID=UPI00064F8F8E|nr:hypothetical protein [Methanosarcina sp. Kolksee]